jgi:hypothetical protein
MSQQEIQELTLSADEFESGIVRVTRPDGTVVMYAIHPQTKKWVEIDPDQAWFWSEEWQAAERRADADVESGRYQDFDDVDDFFDAP